MARLLVAVNSVILLLFGSDMFLVGASEYQRNMRIYASTYLKKKKKKIDPCLFTSLNILCAAAHPETRLASFTETFMLKQPI